MSVSWPSETRFAYDGLVHSVIPTLVNAVLGDDVGPEFIGASERAPGSYTASVTGLTGADRGNYTISPDSVSWFIYDDVTEKKTLKILFTGNSLSQDARMKLPDAAALVPFRSLPTPTLNLALSIKEDVPSDISRTARELKKENRSLI